MLAVIKRRSREFLGRRNSQSGLTLIELMAVIVIIALLFGVLTSGITGASGSAKAKINVTKMQALKGDLAQYRLEYGRYPGSLSGLVSGGDEARQGGKVFFALAKEDDLKDVWNFDYQYRVENNGTGFSLTSTGADGTAGGDGANQDVTITQ